MSHKRNQLEEQKGKNINNSKSGKCEHNLQRCRCRDCGGSSICVHGRHKRACTDCGGSSICVHGRHKRACTDCGGSSICVHGRHKRACKECKNCTHNMRTCDCMECAPIYLITIREDKKSQKSYGSHSST